MIEEIFRELYKAPVEFRWALANSGLKALITGESQDVSPFGKRGRLIRRLVGFACTFGAARLVVALTALAEVTRFMYQARRVQPLRLPAKCRIFVGFGAGPEEEMWRTFEEESDELAIRLDETLPDTFLAYHRPSVFELWKQIWRESGAVLPFLLKSELEPVALFRKNTLTFAALRMAKYILYRTWWAGVEDSSISEVVFISAATPAFACIDAGMALVEYRQHGLHRKSLLMPSFHVLKLLTQIEADYYQQYLPTSEIKVLRPQQRVERHLPCILVASIYEVPGLYKNQDLARVQSLVLWANQNNLEVIIRKHPKETDSFWQTHFPKLEIDATQDRFEDALMRIKPVFVASWFSTSLVDALLANVIPISVMEPGDQHIQDLVFDLLKHCLLWPQHQMTMDALVGGNTDVESVVLGLLSNDTDVLDVTNQPVII